MQELTNEQMEKRLDSLQDCNDQFKVGIKKLKGWKQVEEILACYGLKTGILDQDSNLDTNHLKQFVSGMLKRTVNAVLTVPNRKT